MAPLDAEDVVASIKFLKWQPLYELEKPFQIFIAPPRDAKDQRTTNLVYEDKNQLFRDIRGHETSFDLDNHGFTFRHYPIDFNDFNNLQAVEETYLPEVELLIKAEVDGADKVSIFDWRLRNSAPVEEGHVIDLNKPTDWLRPSLHAHVDQAPGAVFNRIQMQLPNEAEHLLHGRVRVINVWRPLRTPVENWPLAICDGSKVKIDDLIETDHVRRQYTGSTMNLVHRPEYEWYYLNKQTKDEILLLKNFDSSSTVKATCCPHASFEKRDARPDIPRRESIEVRALVFTLP